MSHHLATIIPPQLFDTAIEVVATAVEAGEAIASAIAKGLRALRDSDWYNGVDADVQAQADEEFSSKMALNMAVVATARTVSEGLLRDLADSIGQNASPKTYAKGGVTRKAGTAPLSLSKAV